MQTETDSYTQTNIHIAGGRHTQAYTGSQTGTDRHADIQTQPYTYIHADTQTNIQTRRNNVTYRQAATG